LGPVMGSGPCADVEKCSETRKGGGGERIKDERMVEASRPGHACTGRNREVSPPVGRLWRAMAHLSVPVTVDRSRQYLSAVCHMILRLK
jgi:hypothetical protein